jgi:hypothetical protein
MDYQIKFTDSSKASFVVKPYTANGPKAPAAPTPLFSGAVSANTSLVVLGKGAFDYGEPLQTNMVHLLENFSNITRPSYPIEGQLWYKNAAGGDPRYPADPQLVGLYVYNNTTWDQVATTGSPLTSLLDAGSNKIINLADATNPTDALNLQTGDVRYVNVTGDAMTGILNMSLNTITGLGDAVGPTDAVSLAFVSSHYLPILGGQMLGVLDMNNNKITSVGDATNPQDALNLRTANTLFGAGSVIDGGIF